MERPLLGEAEIVREHGVHRAADDGALDLRGRVDADHRRRVVDRVEVVPAPGLVGRVLVVPRPDDGVWIVQLDPLPLGREQRMWTDEDPRLRQQPTVGAQLADPAADERGLVRSDEARRADVDGEGTVGGQPDLRTEVVARAARRPLEPVVERLRARDHDPAAGNPVQLDRLAGLDLVPDEHPVWHVAQQALVGQIVPAQHRITGADAGPPGRAEPVALRRTQLDQRRNQQQVVVVRVEVADRRGRWGQAALDPAQRPESGGHARPPHGARDPGHTSSGRGCVALGARAELLGVAVAGLEVTEVVDRRPHFPGQGVPLGGAPSRDVAEGDRRKLVGELLQVAGGLGRLHALEDDVDPVAALREQPERACERRHAGVVQHEEDLHVAPTGNGSRASSASGSGSSGETASTAP